MGMMLGKVHSTVVAPLLKDTALLNPKQARTTPIEDGDPHQDGGSGRKVSARILRVVNSRVDMVSSYERRLFE